MKTCPEGAFTAGHLWMAVFGGLILGFVIAAVQREFEAKRKPPC